MNGNNGTVSNLVLEYLSDERRPITAGELADAVGMTHQQADNALNYLSKTGKVERTEGKLHRGGRVSRFFYSLPEGKDTTTNLNVAPVTTEGTHEAILPPPVAPNPLRELPVEILHARRLQNEMWVKSLLDLIAQGQEEVDARRHDMARIDEELCRRKISTPM